MKASNPAGVVKVADSPLRQLEGLPLVLGQRAEASFEPEPRREPLLDHGVPVVGGQVEREAKPFARAGFDTVAADGVREHVGGDSQ